MDTGVSKKVDKQHSVDYPWVKGRNKKFLECSCCGDKFIANNSKYCSTKCKNAAKANIRKEKDTKMYIEMKHITTGIDIHYGSVSENKKIISILHQNGYGLRQILKFIGCNDSGGNYTTIKQLIGG